MNIAILRRNGLGDLLCAYPLVLLLQKINPASSITLFVDSRNAPLLSYLPPVNETVVFPATGNKYWKLFRTAWRYRNKFDLAISAKTSPMKLNNLFLYWLRAKETIAYVDNSWHSKLINNPISYLPSEAKKLHQALKGLRTIAPHLDSVPEELYPILHVPNAIKAKFSVEPCKQPIVIVSASTTQFSNRFAVTRYAALLNRLHAFTPISVRIIGHKNDKVRAESLAKELRMTKWLHFPRNFEEFMVLLDASEVVFVGDGGVAHIGSALKKKCVVLYGGTDPIEWRPLSSQVVIFYHPVHVDSLLDEDIFEALKQKIEEVRCGRDNL